VCEINRPTFSIVLQELFQAANNICKRSVLFAAEAMETNQTSSRNDDSTKATLKMIFTNEGRYVIECSFLNIS